MIFVTNRFLVFSLLFFSLTVRLAYSQIDNYTNYTDEDGLASNSIFCAIQDDRGYMWFGTSSGLTRYDGTSFKNFSEADGLPSVEIINFFKDSTGRIWMLTINGKTGYILGDSIYSVKNTKYLENFKLILKSLASEK